EVAQEARTYATRNTFTISYTVRRFLSTPETGFAVVTGRGEIRQILVRQRGFNVGRNWKLEVSERHKNPHTGKVEAWRLNADTWLRLATRPDHIRFTLGYDSSTLHVETKFISDRPQESPISQVVKIEHALKQAEKILTLITTAGQDAQDQRGF